LGESHFHPENEEGRPGEQEISGDSGQEQTIARIIRAEPKLDQ